MSCCLFNNIYLFKSDIDIWLYRMLLKMFTLKIYLYIQIYPTLIVCSNIVSTISWFVQIVNWKKSHYIHSVVVQDFVSGRACCVNKYHYESRKRRVVMRLVHATSKTWYKVLYQHTIYVIGLSNISIKTNFKQIARVELKCVQYSEGDYILCMTTRYFFRSFTNVGLLYFVIHSNGMTSC